MYDSYSPTVEGTLCTHGNFHTVIRGNETKYKCLLQRIYTRLVDALRKESDCKTCVTMVVENHFEVFDYVPLSCKRR